jgi:hypothetical protein
VYTTWRIPVGQPLTIEWVGAARAISEPYRSHGNFTTHHRRQIQRDACLD